MIRKDQIIDTLGQVQLIVEKLKQTVSANSVDEKVTPVEVLIGQLQNIENSLDRILNLVELEDD
jgi:Zn finger protein HypA/HybF involved in hydrogenase expression|tara:strand:- start:16 stop:207 length:192 start_codon:yes stop_codon:yes gene_type:complete